MTVLLIRGMKCNNCREIIVAALEGVAEVSQADVNLHRGRAVVIHAPGCDPDALIDAVARAGYEAMLQD